MKFLGYDSVAKRLSAKPLTSSMSVRVRPESFYGAECTKVGENSLQEFWEVQ
jgi:hypothetical protein